MTESNVLTILAGVGLHLRVVDSERVQPALHLALPVDMARLATRLLYMGGRSGGPNPGRRAMAGAKLSHAVTVIPNALRSLPEPSGVRRTLIVAVGRLTRQKGFDLLLRAFAHIAPGFADWRLAIIGEGEERQSLMRLCGELLLHERVEFVGTERPMSSAWMTHAGLVVQPSRFEGFPNVVLEAMGLGAAVISSDCRSGPSDMIEDGVNGRLVPVDDVDKLAAVMAELMSRPDERTRLGRRGALRTTALPAGSRDGSMGGVFVSEDCSLKGCTDE